MKFNDLITVFGGTFDPPHIGHYQAVEGLFKQPGTKQVWVVPSATPPQKISLTPVLHRVEMTKILFEPLIKTHQVKINLCEIERSLTQAKPSYTFDTLVEFKKQLPDFNMAVGTDQLLNLESWYRFPEILKLCNWVILERKSIDTEACHLLLQKWQNQSLIKKNNFQNRTPTWQMEGSQSLLTVVPTDACDLSSTQLREKATLSGKIAESDVPPPIFSYIQKHALYGHSH